MIESERLRLRRWRMYEARAYKAIRSDPAVSRTLGPPPTLKRARAFVAAQSATLDALGHCFWAAERKADGELIGWCGIKLGPDHSPIAGLPEIGWTMAAALHRQGWARDAAAAVLAWAWANTGYPRLHAITTPGNRASLGLMERLGMQRVPGGDFDHPALAEGDPLRRHLTYVIERP